MAESLTRRTLEFASGVTGAAPFHIDSSTEDLYPLVQIVPTEIGGCSVYHLAAAATTNATVAKTSAGQVYGFRLFHIDATPVYITFYDTATTPTVDTTTIKMKFGCPAASTAALGAQIDWNFPAGVAFGTGIAFAVHAGIATSTALTASEVLFTLLYK